MTAATPGSPASESGQTLSIPVRVEMDQASIRLGVHVAGTQPAASTSSTSSTAQPARNDGMALWQRIVLGVCAAAIVIGLLAWVLSLNSGNTNKGQAVATSGQSEAAALAAENRRLADALAKADAPPDKPAACVAPGSSTVNNFYCGATVPAASSPAAPAAKKEEKKAPVVDKPAAPASKPGATTSSTFWGWVHPSATATNKKPCYADRNIAGMPSACSSIEVQAHNKDETEDQWRTRMGALAGIKVGVNGITGTKNSDVKVN